MNSRRRSAVGDEGGYVAAELALGIGILLFPIAMLVLTLPTWSERQSAARSIAREVARVAAVDGTCDPGHARQLGTTMAANLGIDPGSVSVDLECPPGEHVPRGGEVTARVEVRMPAVSIPGIGGAGGWTWTAVHHEPVDQYRSF